MPLPALTLSVPGCILPLVKGVAKSFLLGVFKWTRVTHMGWCKWLGGSAMSRGPHLIEAFFVVFFFPECHCSISFYSDGVDRTMTLVPIFWMGNLKVRQRTQGLVLCPLMQWDGGYPRSFLKARKENPAQTSISWTVLSLFPGGGHFPWNNHSTTKPLPSPVCLANLRNMLCYICVQGPNPRYWNYLFKSLLSVNNKM